MAVQYAQFLLRNDPVASQAILDGNDTIIVNAMLACMHLRDEEGLTALVFDTGDTAAVANAQPDPSSNDALSAERALGVIGTFACASAKLQNYENTFGAPLACRHSLPTRVHFVTFTVLQRLRRRTRKNSSGEKGQVPGALRFLTRPFRIKTKNSSKGNAPSHTRWFAPRTHLHTRRPKVGCQD